MSHVFTSQQRERERKRYQREGKEEEQDWSSAADGYFMNVRAALASVVCAAPGLSAAFPASIELDISCCTKGTEGIYGAGDKLASAAQS